MLDIFTYPSTVDVGGETYPEFNYIRKVYVNEVNNVVDYYRNKPYAVKNNHLLAVLLNNCTIPLEYPPDQFVSVATVRAPAIAKHLGLTSGSSKGKVHDGVFYGEGCAEVIFSTEEFFSPDSAAADWRNITAVEVIDHPRSDLGMTLPNGKKTGTETGTAVIAINIPLLMLQYRCFALHQQDKFKELGTSLGVSHFIHMYVLPNMVPRQTELAFVNRCINYLNGAPMGVSLVRHSFVLLDNSHSVDKLIKKFTNISQNKKEKYSTVVKNMPSILYESIENAMLLPDIPVMRQSNWVRLFSRLKYISYLIKLGGNKDVVNNLSELNALRREIKYFQTDRMYQTILPADIMYDIDSELDSILKLM